MTQAINFFDVFPLIIPFFLLRHRDSGSKGKGAAQFLTLTFPTSAMCFFFWQAKKSVCARASLMDSVWTAACVTTGSPASSLPFKKNYLIFHLNRPSLPAEQTIPA